MSESSPQIIPLGSLAEAAAAGAELAWLEQQSIGIEGPGTLTGYHAP